MWEEDKYGNKKYSAKAERRQLVKLIQTAEAEAEVKEQPYPDEHNETEVNALSLPVGDLLKMTTDQLLELLSDYTSLYKSFNNTIYFTKTKVILSVLEYKHREKEEEKGASQT